MYGNMEYATLPSIYQELYRITSLSNNGFPSGYEVHSYTQTLNKLATLKDILVDD